MNLWLTHLTIAVVSLVGTVTVVPTQRTDHHIAATHAATPGAIGQTRGASMRTAHYLTMTLPDTPTKRFTRLSFSFTDPQQHDSIAPIRFNLPQTKAFIGTPNAIAQDIHVHQSWIDETGIVWLEFKPSLSPKTTLTVVLVTDKVSTGTSYNYGIAAYPETASPVPVFVSSGRLTVR